MHWIWSLASLLSGRMLIVRGRRARGIYLTFDDGPNPSHTPALLDLLERHGIKATFFLQGAQVEAHGDIVRRIVGAGHVLGNHSYSHPMLDSTAFRTQIEEIDRTDRALQRHDGRERHLFRPPYGRAGLRTFLVCALRRQRMALWNRDSHDYRLSGGQIVERLSGMALAPGDVLLFHDDGDAGLHALEVLIPRWRAAGFGFGTL